MVNNDGLSPAQLKQRKKNKITLWVTIILSILLLGSIIGWFVLNPLPTGPREATDFTTNVSLEDNLKVTGLKFNASQGDFSDTPSGEWVLDNETGQFTNVNYPGCFMFWSQAGSGASDEASDADNTSQFIDGLSGQRGENMWVPVEGQKGEVEFASSKLVDEEGQHVLAFSRYISNEGVILVGKLSCQSEDELNNLADGKTISDFGIALIQK